MFRGPATLVLPAVAAIAWSVLATHLYNARLLSLPLPLKILCEALGVVPAGTFLGMFYPFGVERVVEAGRCAAMPTTYAMATLSSAWGASWAMTGITNLGFSTVILMGAAGYALTGALVLVARRLCPYGKASVRPHRRRRRKQSQGWCLGKRSTSGLTSQCNRFS